MLIACGGPGTNPQNNGSVPLASGSASAPVVSPVPAATKANSASSPPSEKIEPTSVEEWSNSEKASGIDGVSVSRTKDFNFGNGASLVRVILTCNASAKRLAVQVESYAGNVSEASPLLVENNQMALMGIGLHYVANGGYTKLEFPSGRIKLAGSKPALLGFYFVKDKYRNVMTWNVNQSAVEARDDSLRETWDVRKTAINNEYPNPGGGEPWECRPEVVPHNAKCMPWDKMNAELEREKAERADVEKAIPGAGNFLREKLPVFIEGNNQQGVFEVQIPKGDPGIEELLKLCSVEESAKTITAQSAEEKHPADTSSVAQPSSVSTAPALDVTPNVVPSQVTVATAAPSFDCAKELSNVEKLICSNPELARDDSEVARLYKHAYTAAGPNAVAIKQAQREFMSKRNLCDTALCISDAYRTRLAELAQPGTPVIAVRASGT